MVAIISSRTTGPLSETMLARSIVVHGTFRSGILVLSGTGCRVTRGHRVVAIRRAVSRDGYCWGWGRGSPVVNRPDRSGGLGGWGGLVVDKGFAAARDLFFGRFFLFLLVVGLSVLEAVTGSSSDNDSAGSLPPGVWRVLSGLIDMVSVMVG